MQAMLAVPDERAAVVTLAGNCQQAGLMAQKVQQVAVIAPAPAAVQRVVQMETMLVVAAQAAAQQAAVP